MHQKQMKRRNDKEGRMNKDRKEEKKGTREGKEKKSVEK